VDRKPNEADRSFRGADEGRSAAVYSRLLLPFLCATACAVVLNGTMLPVALPEIGRALSLGPVLLGWVMTGYFVANGVAIPFFGRLADRHGLGHVYGTGLLTFFLGSAACALAPGYAFLMAGRLVQGVGAAAVVGLAPAAVGLAYPPERRGAAIGYIGATVGVGAAIGPLFGGLVTDLLGWRWLFAAGVLFGALAPLARRTLPTGERAAGGRLDLAGGLLLGLALTGGLLALTLGAEAGWTSPAVAACAATAVLSSAGLVLRQRAAESPFVPRALLRNRPYAWLAAVTLLLVGINITVEISLPLPLADVNGLSPSEIGIVLLAPAVATFAFNPVAGRLVDRLGPVVPLRAGVFVLVVAVVLLSGFGVGGPVWATSATVAVISAAATLVKIAQNVGVSLAVGKEDLPSGMAIGETLWIFGVSVGSALFYSALTARDGAAEALNPLHVGPGAAYSDAFLLLAAPLLLILLVSPKLSGLRKKGR
jgi:DHA2 family metal-tetracycline-proton antiporter-like MFS transporter/DHA2 family florfenicol/chloramphenicol resistance protein-like MFS transporter